VQLDLRRKELLGAVVSEYLKESGDTPLAKTLFELVGQKLTKPADRALFPNLPAMRPAAIAGKAIQTTVDTAAQTDN
jgi:hypothetical protein